MKKKIFSLFTALIMACGCIVFSPSDIAEAGDVLWWPVLGHTGLSQGNHDGGAIDIADGSINGADVRAAMGGTVKLVFTCASQHYGSFGDCNGFGTGLVIRGDDNRTYQYAHLQGGSIPAGIGVGSYVSGGQVIGKVGTTGNSSGPHLHFGITGSVNYWESTGINPLNETYNYDSVPAPEPPKPMGHIMTEEEAAGRTIPDGDYWIMNALNYNYFLDPPGYEENNPGDAVHMFYGQFENDIPPAWDTWTLTYLNNGFYKIQHRTSKLSLDVDKGSIYPSAIVKLWNDTGSNAQQWSIERTIHGYRLRPRCNGFSLDVREAKIESGTDLTAYISSDNNKAQEFCFIPYAPDEKPVKDGNYYIKSSMDNNYGAGAKDSAKIYTNGTNIQILKNSADEFAFKYAGNGYYNILEKNSGLLLCVDFSDSSKFMNFDLNVQLNKSEENARNALWKIRKNNDGHYFLISKLNGYYFDLYNKTLDNGNIAVWYCNENLNNKKQNINQQWDFEKVEPVVTTTTTTTTKPAVTTTTSTTTTTKTTTTKPVTTTTVTTTAAAPAMPGDVNGNNKINLSDITDLQKFLLNKGTLKKPENADLNGDGKINVFDLIILKRMLID